MIPVIQGAGSKPGTSSDANEQFIASLFTAGVKGGWYDPSDFSTMFQDSTGITPVTGLNQKVGLILDKSEGLLYGNELINNYNFANGSAKWYGGSVFAPQPISDFGTISNGLYDVNFTIPSTPNGRFAILTQQGEFSLLQYQWYKLEFKFGNSQEIEVDAIQFWIGNNANYMATEFRVDNFQSNTVYSEYFCTRGLLPTDATFTWITMLAFTTNAGTCKFTLEYVSLKKIPGNHLISSEPGAINDFRPTLKGSPNYLDFNESIMTTVGFNMQTTPVTNRKYATFSLGVDCSSTLQGDVPGSVSIYSTSFGRIIYEETDQGAFYQLVLRFGTNKNFGYSTIGTDKLESTVYTGLNSGNYDLVSLGGYKLVWQSVIDFSLSNTNALKNKINSGSLLPSSQLINASNLNTYFNPKFSLVLGWNPISNSFFNGKFYSLIVVGQVSNDATLTQILDYINGKMPP